MKIDIIAIDFDSTFITEESMDVLFKIALRKNNKRSRINKKLKEINKQLMDKKIDFKTSLEEKINILKYITKKIYFTQIAEFLKTKISPEIKKILDFSEKNNKKIMVFSNSFKNIIEPIMKFNNIEIFFSNVLFFDEEGYIIDYDKGNMMAKNDGKSHTIKFLKDNGFILPEEKIMVIGDGFSDYSVYKNKLCNYFINFAIYSNRNLKKYKKDDTNFINCFSSSDFDNVINNLE